MPPLMISRTTLNIKVMPLFTTHTKICWLFINGIKAMQSLHGIQNLGPTAHLWISLLTICKRVSPCVSENGKSTDQETIAHLAISKPKCTQANKQSLFRVLLFRMSILSLDLHRPFPLSQVKTARVSRQTEIFTY